MKVNILHLVVEFTIKLIQGKGKLSFGHALFKSVNLMHIFHLSFDFQIKATFWVMGVPDEFCDK